MTREPVDPGRHAMDGSSRMIRAPDRKEPSNVKSCDYDYDSENRCNRPTDETGRCDEHYRSQAARDARRAGYGDESYWKYLDRAAQEHYDYFMARGDTAKAESMFTESLSEALAGNDGD